MTHAGLFADTAESATNYQQSLWWLYQAGPSLGVDKCVCVGSLCVCVICVQVGMIACNDYIMLECCIYRLLKFHFADSPSYGRLLDLFLEVRAASAGVTRGSEGGQERMLSQGGCILGTRQWRHLSALVACRGQHVGVASCHTVHGLHSTWASTSRARSQHMWPGTPVCLNL